MVRVVFVIWTSTTNNWTKIPSAFYAGSQTAAQMVTVTLHFRSKKLIQESDQHLKDVEKILQNDKRYLVLDCVPEERRKLIVSYVDDLDRRGPPPPPTASEPTRRTTK